MPKPILSKAQLSQIRRSRMRHGGKKIVTDDVKKLKSLSTEPDFPVEEKVNYYQEPVEIEYYIPKESRFQVDIKYLYIRLVDPEPRNANQKLIFDYFAETGACFDLVEVMNNFPQFLMPILESYEGRMTYMENLSLNLQTAARGEPDAWQKALYMVEMLRHFEPTLCSLEILGDFVTLSINWLVRALNRSGRIPRLEDGTVSYLIKIYRDWMEKNDIAENERFTILVELFFQQAYPNRGAISYDELVL